MFMRELDYSIQIVFCAESVLSLWEQMHQICLDVKQSNNIQLIELPMEPPERSTKFMFQSVLDLKFGLIQKKPSLLIAQQLESGILTEPCLDITLTLRVMMPENLDIMIFTQLLLQLHKTTLASTDKMHWKEWFFLMKLEEDSVKSLVLKPTRLITLFMELLLQLQFMEQCLELLQDKLNTQSVWLLPIISHGELSELESN